MLNKLKLGISIVVTVTVVQSCAVIKVQKGKKISEVTQVQPTKKTYQFFLIGDAGDADKAKAQETLNLLKKRLDTASDNSTLLFLGDNIYPNGMPSKKDPQYALAQTKLENQLKIAKDFKGKTIVIPGNHDWYSGTKGLNRQEKFVNSYFDKKKSFLPKKNCPIEQVKINSDISLITIDSQWFLENWSDSPGINDDCDIKTRESFFSTFENLINKNQNKTIVVAIHHPLLSGGTHAGYFSMRKQLYPLESKIPLPIIGTAINTIRATSGLSPQDMNSRYYSYLVNKLKNIVQGNDNVIFVSGHEHNLQYLEQKNIKQIISGAGSKNEAAKLIGDKNFSFGGSGYAILNIEENGSATVSYYSTENNKEKLLTTIKVLDSEEGADAPATYPSKFSNHISSTVYPPDLTKKSKFYQFLWGKHYRKYYGMPISAQVATLDTLKGGLYTKRAGGGHQSNSLRLVDKEGQEFVMRGIKKSATRFLNAVAFKTQSFGNELDETFTEKFILDFYTTSHPFLPFSVGNLAEKVGVEHSNPLLYYIPKQQELKGYNKSYGNELYMVEERFSDSDKDLQLLGNATATMNTEDMMSNLEKSSKYTIDEKKYIRSRLFDMLIGDWDRHYDQWRWAEYKEGDQVIYKPIPKDRDQAFSKYDGFMFSFIMRLPALAHMQSFGDNIENVKWFNREPYPLDLKLLKTTNQQDWIDEAQYIRENLTDKDIDEAFNNLPQEVQDETIKDIQQKLKIRREKLATYAIEYYRVLQKIVPIVGTNKEDKFVITKGKDNIIVYQYKLRKDGEDLVFTKQYNQKDTKEIWIYGLDDDDVFEVKGNYNPKIKLRIIGGQGKDIYNVENGKKTLLYDYKTKKNTFNIDGTTRKRLTDNYTVNSYDYTRPKYNYWTVAPALGYNPDDGLGLGAGINYFVNKFIQDPYSQKHSLSANYYWATKSMELRYKSTFMHALGKWSLNLGSRYATSNFVQNFYGYGNETINLKKELGKNYYRARMEQFDFTPSINKKSFSGVEQELELNYSINKVEQNFDRYIGKSTQVNPDVFKNQQFAGAKYTISYDHNDNAAFPTMGFGIGLSAAWKVNLENTDSNFMSYLARINLTHRLDNRGRLVYATRIEGEYINNKNYEFYQGAVLGGDQSLRSFRRQRFLGNSSLMQTNDIRWSFGRIKNKVMPIDLGIFVGYDYGRVWIDNEDSSKWHQSVGGGFWFSILESLSARVTYFNGTDGGRVSAGLGLRF